MLKMAVKFRVGITNSTVGKNDSTGTVIPRLMAVREKIKTIATGVAQTVATLCSTNQAIKAGKTISGHSADALNVATQKLKITPASMAEAIGFGIEETNLPNLGQRPVSSNSKLEKMKAPTASENGRPSSPEEISSAAPGVLQTMLMGIRYFRLRKIESNPKMAVFTTIADVVWDLVAPKAWKAESAMPKLAAVPVIDATVPARNGALWSARGNF